MRVGIRPGKAFPRTATSWAAPLSPGDKIPKPLLLAPSGTRLLLRRYSEVQSLTYSSTPDASKLPALSSTTNDLSITILGFTSARNG